MYICMQVYVDHLVSTYVCYIYKQVCTLSCKCMYYTNQLVGTTDGHKLFNAEHTNTILSMAGRSLDFLGLTNSIDMQLIISLTSGTNYPFNVYVGIGYLACFFNIFG